MKKIISLLATVCLTFGLTACGGNSKKNHDSSKSQLYVSCWDGGFGVEWLESIGKRFEDFYKDQSLETGKTGVQVWVTASKGNVYDSFATNILSSTDDICISEQCNYNGFVKNNSAVDITDVVTTPLTEFGETRSIADKLSLSDREYYGVGSDTYYGLPWYESTFGFQYDIDLFEEENLYFASEGQGDSDGFIKRSDSKRSVGPDGLENTEDDGLPATYEEFFKLCDRIYELEMVPLIWAGNAPVYLNNLISSLAADYEGYEQMALNYNLNGTANNLVKSISNGNVTFEEPTVIDNSNGYLLKKQAGYYYAMSFIEKILKTKDNSGNFKYYDKNKTSDTRTQKQAQSDFLRGRFSNNVKTYAMLIDGSWWYAEANATFNQMASIPGASSNERRIGFMPMPKVDKEHAGEATYFNSWMTSVNIRGNIESSRVNLAKQFIRFMHTDESLSEFTRITSGVRPFSYELTSSDRNNTSYYGKQLLGIHNKNTVEHPTIVNPWSRNNLVLNNLASFMINDQMYNTKVGTGSYSIFYSAVKDYNVSAENYFKGLSIYWNKSNWEMAYSNYFN